MTKKHIAAARLRHHAALKRLASRKCKLTGLQIWRRLRRLEAEATRITTDLCNGTVDQELADSMLDAIEIKVATAFGRTPKGFFIQRDPRGTALQLDCDEAPVPDGMQTNWGGNGILAAEIND
jgi:hypothetical protein